MLSLEEQNQDSDSSSCDVDHFSAVCDPSLEHVFLSTKSVNIEDFVAPVEPVTGDVDLDCTLRDVKKACRNFTGPTNSSAEVPSTTCRYTRARPTGPSFLLSMANTMLEKRVLVQAETDYQPKTPQGAPHTIVDADVDGESFQLLPDVSVSSRPSEGDEQPRVSPSGLRKLQRRHGFSFFHPDEEDCLEERCKKIAISGQFIANKGLAIPYAERRNVNPKKLIRIQATPVEVDQNLEDTKKKKRRSSNCATTDGVSASTRVPHENQAFRDKSENPNDTQKVPEIQPNAEKRQNNSNPEESNTSKKKKARKRGPKKGHKKAKLSEAVNDS